MSTVNAADNREKVSLEAVKEILEGWNPSPRKKSAKEKALSMGGVSVMVGFAFFVACFFSQQLAGYFSLISTILIAGGFCYVEYDSFMYSDLKGLPDSVISSLADDDRVSVEIKKYLASVINENSTITMRELLSEQQKLADKERLQGQVGYQKIIKFKGVEVEDERS